MKTISLCCDSSAPLPIQAWLHLERPWLVTCRWTTIAHVVSARGLERNSARYCPPWQFCERFGGSVPFRLRPYVIGDQLSPSLKIEDEGSLYDFESSRSGNDLRFASLLELVDFDCPEVNRIADFSPFGSENLLENERVASSSKQNPKGTLEPFESSPFTIHRNPLNAVETFTTKESLMTQRTVFTAVVINRWTVALATKLKHYSKTTCDTWISCDFRGNAWYQRATHYDRMNVNLEPRLTQITNQNKWGTVGSVKTLKSDAWFQWVTQWDRIAVSFISSLGSSKFHTTGPRGRKLIVDTITTCKAAVRLRTSRLPMLQASDFA